MPKHEINSDNTHFYKIVCRDLDVKEIYVGSTTDFRRRKNEHKRCSNYHDHKIIQRKLYQHIQANGGWENFDMILIETCKCENSLDCKRKERQYIEEMKATLNMTTPSRTQQEYHQEEKEKEAIYTRSYLQRDDVIARRKSVYECSCGGRYTHPNKMQHLNSNKHIDYYSNEN